jgi:hypothetical protein
MHSMMAGKPLNEVMGAFAREQAGLADGGAPAGVARAGTILPNAELLDVHGAATALSAAVGGGAAVPVFYRSAAARTASSCRPTRRGCSPS